jgi:dTDP-L-rhamnose 4-epimerase
MPDHLNPGAEYRWGDVTNPSDVFPALAGVDAVSHQAAMVGLGVDFTDVEAYVRTNDVGTAVLLRALAERRFAGRLVVASSMVVYGEGAYRCPRHGPVRPLARRVGDLHRGRFEPSCPECGSALEPEPVTENAPVDPRNVYAATKLHQEHLAASFGRTFGLPVASLRYHNVYGPRMPRNTPYAGVAAIFRSALEDHVAPQVNEDGRQRRDFVHVNDVARANVLALRPDAPAGAFNVCTGEPRTVGELANALASAFGPSAPSPVVNGRYRLGDVRHVFASPVRASAILGFDARVTFEEGMREFANGEAVATTGRS